ncbi:MAG: nitroreductase family protein [Candidatus Woesearchaeota archaeon]
MEAIDCIKERRSVRTYIDKDIGEDILKDIVDCARQAASARNTQGWEFIVIKDKDTLRKIADIAPNGKFIESANAAIITIAQDSDYYLEDGSAATQNILLAARAYDIGSCWIAGAKKEYADDVLDLIEAPENYKLISIVSLGYTDEFPEKSKRPLEAIYHEEVYKN